LHGSIMLLLLVQALWLPLPSMGPQPAAEQAVETRYDPIDEEPLIVEMEVDERPWIARDAEDPTYVQVNLNDPRWDDILQEPLRRAEGIEASEADVAAGTLISEQLRRSIEASSDRSDDENLQNLATLSDRLGDVSSEETIDELSGMLSRLVGTKQRATKPKEDVGGPFDLSTAQPHDCRKEEMPDGTVKYVVVMIDAEGRTQEIEVDQASGEQLYKTMQIVKSNPLLERVYRGVVMSLLDKLMQPIPPK